MENRGNNRKNSHHHHVLCPSFTLNAIFFHAIVVEHLASWGVVSIWRMTCKWFPRGSLLGQNMIYFNKSSCTFSYNIFLLDLLPLISFPSWKLSKDSMGRMFKFNFCSRDYNTKGDIYCKFLRNGWYIAKKENIFNVHSND